MNSPDIRNYYIGKGSVYFKGDNDSEYHHMGNVPELEFTPEVETLEHFSSMAGVKSKDRTEVISKSGTLRIVCEEWTARNLALALLGSVGQDSEGNVAIEIFASTAVSGKIRFIGNNDVGPKWQLDFNRVDFVPGSSVNPISDEWGQLELTGNVAAVAGSFGTATKLANEGDATEDSELGAEPGSDAVSP